MCWLRLWWHLEEDEEGYGSGDEPWLPGASHEYSYQKPALPKIAAPRELPSSGWSLPRSGEKGIRSQPPAMVVMMES
jgi:hypothetical protein